jgi:hypothetical protein
MFEQAKTVHTLDGAATVIGGIHTRETGEDLQRRKQTQEKYVVVHLSSLLITHYTASNNWMIVNNELKGRGTKWSWSKVRYCSGIYPAGPKKGRKTSAGLVHVQTENRVRVGSHTDRASLLGGNMLHLSANVFPSASNEIPLRAARYKIGNLRTDSISWN